MLRDPDSLNFLRTGQEYALYRLSPTRTVLLLQTPEYRTCRIPIVEAGGDTERERIVVQPGPNELPRPRFVRTRHRFGTIEE